jgi:probable HAF family extracellular repeat protein
MKKTLKSSLFVAFAMLTQLSYALPSFSVQEVIAPSGHSASLFDINDKGQAVGSVTDAFGNFYPVVYENGNLTKISDVFGSASRINNDGTITAILRNADGLTSRPSIYKDGTFNDISLSGRNASSVSINTPGTVIGTYAPFDNTSGQRSVFVYADGLTRIITSPTYLNLTARDVNDLGLIVGSEARPSISGMPTTRAISISPDGTINNLHELIPGARTSSAWAANNTGQIVGQFSTGSSTRTFLLTGDNVSVLETPTSWTFVTPRSINNAGTIVGIADNSSGFDSFFIYENGAIYDLLELVGLNFSGLDLITNSVQINNVGQILVNVSGVNSRSFILTPNSSNVPVPSSALLILIGLVLAAKKRRNDEATDFQLLPKHELTR